MAEPFPGLHRVEWTPQKVSRFWGWWCQVKSEETFFSAAYGASVLRFAEKSIGSTKGHALDVGTGHGHLLPTLLDAGFTCAGVDSSSEAASLADARLAGRAGFAGVFAAPVEELPFPDDAFDLVFALEVIEHLLPDSIDRAFWEFARVTRPGGGLIVTTPNDEDLSEEDVICPDCGAVFHRMQHVQRWTGERLSELAGRHGFDRVALDATLLAASRRQWVGTRLKALAQRALALQPTRLDANLMFAGRRAG